MEATGKVVSPKQRAIFLTIRRINQMLVIKVENSFSSHSEFAVNQVVNRFISRPNRVGDFLDRSLQLV